MIAYDKLIGDIWKAGGKAYIVGGMVRDGILDRRCEDIDMEVLGIPRDKFESILNTYGKSYRCGKIYEIYLLSSGAHKIEISYIEEDIKLEELAKRRDFTINALYYNPIKNEVVDFFCGEKDIENKIVRATTKEVFKEDPLRIIRGAELASRLSFEIEEETMNLMKKSANELGRVAKERIVEELKKIYFLSEKPSIAFEKMNEANIFQALLPRLSNLQNIIQDKIYHPEGDVYTHILMMLDVLPKEKRSMEVFWGIIYHDMGKEETWPEFKNHSLISKRILQEEGKDLIKDKKILKSVETLVEYHEEPLRFLLEGFDRIELKKLAVKVDIPKLLDLYLADVLGRGRKENESELEIIDKIIRIYSEIKEELIPIIRGRDLIEWGVENKKNYSEIIARLFKAQLEEKFCDKVGAKSFYLSEIRVSNIYKGK